MYLRVSRKQNTAIKSSWGGVIASPLQKRGIASDAGVAAQPPIVVVSSYFGVGVTT
jgi:hypothetical protein